MERRRHVFRRYPRRGYSSGVAPINSPPNGELIVDWFENLFGFSERAYEETQSKFAVKGGRLISRVNGRSWSIGEFEMAPLAKVRRRAAAVGAASGKPSLRIVQGDVRKMHAAPEYGGALFQVASQFNALEMVGPDVVPEDGVTDYAYDHTQGPACALAAAPAMVYRNYFAPVGDGVGQTRDRQLDGLADIGAALSAALGRPTSDLWQMRNGYALCNRSSLEAISAHLSTLDDDARDALRGRLSIAIQRSVEVTEPGAPAGQFVSQAYCSALPVRYGGGPARLWAPFATLVLEAAYEATLLEAAASAARGGSNIVLLTMLGGGVFGNEREWIFAAIRRALTIAAFDLDVRIVSFGSISPDLKAFVKTAGR